MSSRTGRCLKEYVDKKGCNFLAEEGICEDTRIDERGTNDFLPSVTKKQVEKYLSEFLGDYLVKQLFSSENELDLGNPRKITLSFPTKEYFLLWEYDNTTREFKEREEVYGKIRREAKTIIKEEIV